jgi:transposase
LRASAGCPTPRHPIVRAAVAALAAVSGSATPDITRSPSLPTVALVCHRSSDLDTIPIARLPPAVQFNPASMRSRPAVTQPSGCATSQKPPDSRESLIVIQSCPLGAALGVTDRLVLSDGQWDRIAPLIIGRPDQKGSTGRDNRMFVEGVLWIVRTGAPWRDLPEAFGDWNGVFRRFSRWSCKGIWWRIFEAMSDDPDFEYLIIDSTVVRAHQHASGAKKGGLKIRRSAAYAAV